MGCVPRDVWRCWRRHMRAALVRKYLTLSAVNHAQETSLRYEFQTAISHTVDQVIDISPVSPLHLPCISPAYLSVSRVSLY